MSPTNHGSRGTAVRAQGVCKYFGDVVALDGIDLVIPAGSVHGIVGPNGAGKTTLLGLLLGLAAADAGELEVLGARASHLLEVPEGVSGFVDAPGLYPAQSARQNLVQLCRLRGLADAPRRAADALAEVGLTDVADDRVRGFSLGMRQRLGLAAAMLTEPRLLVLDEPSNGLDPAGRRQVHEVLTRLAAGGTAIVLSSHRMDDLSRLCDGVTLLARGRVAFTGTIPQLAAHSRSLEHRLVTTDIARTRELVHRIAGLDVARSATDEALVVSGTPEAVDGLVSVLVRQGIGLRELAPTVPPLEAAFLALTGDGDDALAGTNHRDDRPVGQDSASGTPDHPGTAQARQPSAGARQPSAGAVAR